MLKLLQKLKTAAEVKTLLEIAAGLRAENRDLTATNLNLMSENTELKKKIAKLEEDNKMLHVYVDERFTPDLYVYGAEEKEGE